jgi:hypothetical protein
MARRHKKTMAATIFENVLFLEEVFGYKDDADIPDVPVLELAKCFELSHPRTLWPPLRPFDTSDRNFRRTRCIRMSQGPPHNFAAKKDESKSETEY